MGHRPHCPACGYDRSGIAEDALCPECGSPMGEPRIGQDISAGAARASIALGLGTLSWLGLIGFGIVAVLLGIGAVAVAISAIHLLKSENGHGWKPMATAQAGLVLGLSGIVAGLVVTAVLVMAI